MFSCLVFAFAVVCSCLMFALTVCRVLVPGVRVLVSRAHACCVIVVGARAHCVVATGVRACCVLVPDACAFLCVHA